MSGDDHNIVTWFCFNPFVFLDSADYLGILGNLAGCSDVGVIDFLICFGYLLVGESEKLVRIVTFVQRKYKRYGFIYRKILCKILFSLC